MTNDTEPKQADDWNALAYAQHSSLQEAMANEVLGRLALQAHARVLDIGCGDGKLSARIADRVPEGRVLGVDASPDMVEFAARHFAAGGSQARANLRFEVMDARALDFDGEFDVIVSFNALHWVPEQATALRGIAAALRPQGRAMLRLVVKGDITSLEEVAEATRALPRWATSFAGFVDPYLRLTAPQYAQLAEAQGLRVLRQHTQAREWDFCAPQAFIDFCSAGFGAWTSWLPESRRDAFVQDVIDAYRAAAGHREARAHVFGFYQMDIELTAAPVER